MILETRMITNLTLTRAIHINMTNISNKPTFKIRVMIIFIKIQIMIGQKGLVLRQNEEVDEEEGIEVVISKVLIKAMIIRETSTEKVNIIQLELTSIIRINLRWNSSSKVLPTPFQR